GSWMNLAAAIRTGSVVFFLAAGAVLFAVALVREARRRPPIGPAGARGARAAVAAILFGLLGSLALLQYAAVVSTSEHRRHVSTSDDRGHVLAFNFNRHDDFHAYIVFPRKMIQTGELGRDPFSVRRMVASLGGQSFLHALVLAGLQEQNLHLMEPGIGLLLAF